MRETIVWPDHDVYVSAATIWEVEIKRALGRLHSPADLVERIADAQLRPLPITFAHASHAGRLPRLHDDPFDRMLIAQGQLEGLTIATADPAIARYDVSVLTVPRP